jgi:hypothetical protein
LCSSNETITHEESESLSEIARDSSQFIDATGNGEFVSASIDGNAEHRDVP